MWVVWAGKFMSLWIELVAELNCEDKAGTSAVQI